MCQFDLGCTNGGIFARTVNSLYLYHSLRSPTRCKRYAILVESRRRRPVKDRLFSAEALYVSASPTTGTPRAILCCGVCFSLP